VDLPTLARWTMVASAVFVAVNAKLPCSCGSLIPAGKCCEKQAHQKVAPKILRERERSKKGAVVKKPKGFPITIAQLRHADPQSLARLMRFLDLEDPKVRTYERLAEVLNEGVTMWKRAHIAVNRKR